MANSPHVFEVTDATFQSDVIDPSHSTPVVVDFWAPWCGPCKALGPVIEALAAEADGAWVLAKINTDENQQTAQTFGIQGIPNVKAIIDGRVVDEFSGALPRAAILSWLEKVVPSEAESAIKKAASAEVDGDIERALTMYRALAEEDADNVDAILGVARTNLALGRFDAMLDWFQKIDPHHAGASSGLYNQLWFPVEASKVRALPELELALKENPKDVEALYEAALRYGESGEWERALGHLLEIVKIDRGFRDDIGRLTMIRAFKVMGDDNPRTDHWQNELGRWMY